MRFVFFDTETTGLPLDNNAPYTDIDNWPRLVQLAWIIYDNRNIVARKNYIIKPVGFTIPKQATSIHGISTEHALNKGSKVENVLRLFLEDVATATAIIGHNLGFDLKVILSELFRLDIDNEIGDMDTLDTMLLSTNFCKIPNRHFGYRYPKLIELYSKLFSESFDNMHDAMADIEATARCFWALLDRGIIDKEKYTFLLTENEKNELANKYNKQAIEIVWGTRKGTQNEVEELYLKSAKLGSTEGMYKVALKNMGGYMSNRKDYDTAIYWLEEIVRLSKTQEVSWYKETLQNLQKIYTERGELYKAEKYSKLLENEENRIREKIINTASFSESGFYELVFSIREGKNGFEKDKERADKLMVEGVEKGYRSLYWMYSRYLIEQGDERYFYYLLESVKDVEKKLEQEYSSTKSAFNGYTANYLYKTHKNFWLTDKYRLIAEGYLKGFGVKQDTKTAESYLLKALSCSNNDNDYKTVFFLAKLYNGEYGNDYIDFDKSIRKLESLPLKYMDDKYPYALLGDAYFGKSWSNFFKAFSCYRKYPEINKYKSALRKKYCRFRNIILVFFIVVVILLTFL